MERRELHAQPYGLRAALGHLLVVGSAPSLWQKEYSTAALADKYVDQYLDREHEDDRCQRFSVPIRCFTQLRSLEGPRQDPGARDAGQCAGRFLESGRDGCRGAGNQESEDREIRPDADQRPNARPLHVFPSSCLAELPRSTPRAIAALSGRAARTAWLGSRAARLARGIPRGGLPLRQGALRSRRLDRFGPDDGCCRSDVGLRDAVLPGEMIFVPQGPEKSEQQRGSRKQVSEAAPQELARVGRLPSSRTMVRPTELHSRRGSRERGEQEKV